jgi:hypothetical protein
MPQPHGHRNTAADRLALLVPVEGGRGPHEVDPGAGLRREFGWRRVDADNPEPHHRRPIPQRQQSEPQPVPDPKMVLLSESERDVGFG